MSNTSGIGLDGMGVDGSGVDKQNTGVGDSTEGVVVDTVETVKVLTENTEIATFIENSDTLGKNELNKLEETTSNTKKFFEELSPLIANIKELAKHLGITIMGLEEDKKENEKKLFIIECKIRLNN